MGYEIDFLPVGDGEKSGDAIALRYGNLAGSRDEQVVVVVDGGFTDDGEALVDHIRTHYGTDSVDIVVSTHPDQDHTCGLKVVLEQCDVGELWMHQPWDHSSTMRSSRVASFNSISAGERMQKSLQGASELETLALSRGIPIREPFLGMASADQAFIVAGPTVEFYEEQLRQALGEESVSERVRHALQKVIGAVKGWLQEDHETETLTDSGTTSPWNNSSAICLLQFDGKYSLLTADAGMPALDKVTNFLNSAGIASGELNFVQIPHHGSRHNVGPTVLDRLLGAKGRTLDQAHAISFVSAAKNATHKHPHKKVTNAFTRRGYKVVTTGGSSIRHSWNAPEREGWIAAPILPLFDQVEDDD